MSILWTCQELERRQAAGVREPWQPRPDSGYLVSIVLGLLILLCVLA